MDKAAGYLVISLDFELLWGVFDVMDLERNRVYFQNTRKIIPKVLDLFEKNAIHATWATVGMLFNDNWKEWENNIPQNIPLYDNIGLCAYKFAKERKEIKNHDLCFAPQLIRQISLVKGQEVGTHTYSHYYCQEPGQSIEDFNKDLNKSIELAEKLDISITSLVFPRNQFNKEYLEICAENGIKNVRSNPDSWYWKNARSTALLTRFARTGDAYVSLGKKSYALSSLKRKNGLPLEQPASRFLRPVENKKILRTFKLDRLFKEMDYAAKKGEIYHLWWHPHNFGNAPEESLKDLEKIIEYYKRLQLKYNFQSLNMQELGEKVP